MIKEYMHAAVKYADYKKLEDGSWYAEIKELPGVWANANTLEACRSELIEVLEEWLLLKIRDNDSIPVIDGKRIEIQKTAV